MDEVLHALADEEQAHRPWDLAGSSGDGGRTCRCTADRSTRRVPALAGAAGCRACRRTPGRATQDLQPAPGGLRRGRRMAGAVPRTVAEPTRCPAHGDHTRKEGTEMRIIATMRALDQTRGSRARRRRLRHRHPRPVEGMHKTAVDLALTLHRDRRVGRGRNGPRSLYQHVELAGKD